MRGKRLSPDLKQKRENRIVTLLAEKRGYDDIISILKREGLGCSTGDIARVKRGLGDLSPIAKPRRSENETNFWRNLKAQFEQMGIHSLSFDGNSFKVSRTSTTTIKVK